jgi:hypothetical protein
MFTSWALLTLALASPPPEEGTARPVIAEARPLTCAVPDVHPAIVAGVTPASQIVDVRVFFRTVDPAPKGAAAGAPAAPAPSSSSAVNSSERLAQMETGSATREVFPGESSSSTPLSPSTPSGGGVYRVRLEQDGESWKGLLPRPTSRVKRFAYVIEVYDSEARVTRSVERVVRVAQKGAPCAPGEAPVLELAPPKDGVAVMAPSADAASVPEGFSSKGSQSTGSAKVGATNMRARTSLLVSLGVGAAAGAVALSKGYQPDESGSNVEIVATEPGPGATIPLSSGRVAIRLRLTGPEDVAPGQILVALRRGFLTCVDLRVQHPGIRARTPLEITVDSVTAVYCAAPFDVQSARVDVRGPDQRTEFSRELPLQYSFVP